MPDFRFILLAGVCVACAALSGCDRNSSAKQGGTGAAKAAAGPSREFSVRISPVSTQDVTYRIETVGELVEENRFVLPARVAGSAEAVVFTDGDRVTTGQVLTRIDTSRYQLLVDKADAVVREQEAAVRRAEADLADTERRTSSTVATTTIDLQLAEQEYQRRQRFAQGEVISIEDRTTFEAKFRKARTLLNDAVGAAQTQVELARAAMTGQRTALETARLALSIARDDLEKSIVRAPIAGVIQERKITTGQYLKAGDEVAIMVQMNPIRLRFKVPESKSAVLAERMAVQFEVPALPQRTFRAHVYDVGTVADTESREVTCWARLDNTDMALRPGNFASVSIAVKSNNRAVVVPLGAVQPTEVGTVVYVVQDKRAIRRKVSTGIQVTGDAIEILSGLEPGEKLVVEGMDSLQPGVPVKVLPPAPAGGTPIRASGGESTTGTAPRLAAR
jgi:multidrug efflux system membrane fusion protein